ncbi:dephospho-CoA kinase [Haloechinothrix sp. LS1_15]|uniref:dephospho-CoA kinase n=1 Tax=Haloechinothrix sp. LS1_15 TaxID=2652248 RepID=UPI0029461EFF|nr:dephospho-CoA kinase [Haloechinothrix sp. LS1_15]MDV6012241.1 dephospho-CoA kinase [Haloechinothrix sp. LS1_15]
MLSVGLTGGIGAGKSTVAHRLVEHGAVLVDADAIAREVVQPGRPALAEIVAVFGEQVLADDGTLDRAALAERAFADEESRVRLNGIVHPRVGERTAELVGGAPQDAIVVHDVPLLVENGLAPLYHLVIVVDAPEDVRVDRLVEARGMTAEDARARIAAQADERSRREAADVWLDNSGAPDGVLAEVDALWADRLVPFEANLRLRRPQGSRSPSVVEPDPTWRAQAARAIARIEQAAGETALRVDHIGSTSVPGLPAKDVLDIQLTVADLTEADRIADALAEAGFPRMAGQWSDDPLDPGQVGPRGDKRLHTGADPARRINLHVREQGTPHWRAALLFPVWLSEHPAERDAYAELKRKLAHSHRADGTAERYAENKQPWIAEAMARAEEWARATGWSP